MIWNNLNLLHPGKGVLDIPTIEKGNPQYYSII